MGTLETWQTDLGNFAANLTTPAYGPSQTTRRHISNAVKALIAKKPYDTTNVLNRSDGSLLIHVQSAAYDTLVERLEAARTPAVAEITSQRPTTWRTHTISIVFTARPTAP